MKRGFVSLFILLSVFIFGHSQIQINEFMAKNAYAYIDTTYYNFNDWIELKNTSDSAVDLTGFFLTNTVDVHDLWCFPANTVLDSGAYLLVWADSKNNQCHTNFKLDGDTGYLAIISPELEVLDEVYYSEQIADVSYGREKDTSRVFQFFARPTPWLPNLTKAFGNMQSSKPLFSLAGGFYSGGELKIAIESIDTATIYFTTDGSLPTLYSPVYTDTISFDTTTIIRAIAQEPNKLPSAAVTHSYFINEHKSTLPVISISTDPDNLWNDTIGIYVVGTNGLPLGYMEPANFNQNWERPVNIEYFDTSQNLGFNCMAGVEIYGNASRTKPQKSFTVEFKKKYGTAKLRYPVFMDEEIDKFKSLILRNSGNDGGSTQLRDALLQEIVSSEMDIDCQSYQPAAIYLNGEYWGILNIRDRYDETYLETHHKANPDSVDILAVNEVKAGSLDGYLSMIDYLDNNNMADSLHYAHMKTLVDVQELINYVFVETYINNTDWPRKNQKCWSSQTPEGKWRWLVFDLDISSGIWNQQPSNDLLKETLDNPITISSPYYPTYVFRKLLVNEEFKNQFINTVIYHSGTTFHPDRVQNIVDTLQENISDEIVYHLQRWGGSYNYWNKLVNQIPDWLSQRNYYYMASFAQYFDYGTAINFEIFNSMPHAGQVIWEGEKLSADTLSGVYPTKYYTNAKAVAYNGYKFKQWNISGEKVDTVLAIVSGSSWLYFNDSIGPDSGWQYAAFDDSGWKTGFSEFGYGDGDESTILEYGMDTNKYRSYYFRKKFDIADTISIANLSTRIKYDDGIAVYLNGIEIIREYLPSGELNDTILAKWARNAGKETSFYFYELDTSLLVSGTNVLAVEVHQHTVIDDDISFDLEMFGIRYPKLPDRIITTNLLQIFLEGNMHISAEFDTCECTPALFINEVMPYNLSFSDEYGEMDDWVEIYNAGDTLIDIAGLYFSDNIEKPRKWQIPYGFPDATTILPNGFLVLWADGQPEQGPLHLNFKLSGLGETVSVYRENENFLGYIDTLSYGYNYSEKTIGRYMDGSENITMLGTPTPGDSNILIYEPPVISSIDEVYFQCYPNPTTDKLILENIFYQQIEVYSMQGKLIQKINGCSNSAIIDFAGNPQGMYVIIIYFDDTTFTKKIIKK